MDLTAIPDKAYDLILELDEAIPHRCPSRNMQERDIWFYAGKRDLIDALKARLEAAAVPSDDEGKWTEPMEEDT